MRRSVELRRQAARVARLTPERERELVEALCTVGDKVTRVLRPLANGDKWFAQ